MEIPFTTIDWSLVPKKEKSGKQGISLQQEVQYPGLRVRIVEYSAGYFADEWCQKGHIVAWLEGSVESEMESGDRFQLSKGMMYIVSDQMSSHRSITSEG